MAKATMRKLVVYPLIATMLAAGACYVKPKALKLVELVRAFKEVNAPEDGFDMIFINDYIRLLNAGIPPKAIPKIPCYDFDGIIRALESKKIPQELIQYFTHSQKEYSINAAARNPIFGTDKEKVRSYIKEHLSKVQHLPREYADYNEGAFQIDSVENINMLYLVKGYTDYFQDENNRREISRLIREDLEDPFSEHGGIVISDNGKYKFANVNPLKKRVNNLEDNFSYVGEDWAKYIGAIGEYHFHATQDDDSEYAGPSGSAQRDHAFSRGDIGCLIRSNRTNPYAVHCVITKMKGNKFNADIYFRDVKTEFKMELWGARSNWSNVTVLDLGVFDMTSD